ncbi:hypothetical protein S40285_03448 [Stachybotrys chlorohalonatus IBT 40285]|uniref:Uncharacterized protein n=1 Tax=Stachybotrys chlorohalonatus (strain IBT 40285) TaxID=1283841 RepID=A0A084QBX1_STAC4|nr:hypothetical protein S40285_03448 [Stachybotrys chlorohalonata IBT 40285]
MGFLDAFGDSVSVVSGGFTRPAQHRRRSSKHGGSSSHHKKRRSRSRSRSRSSSRHRGAPSIAGTLFGLGDDGKHSHYHKHNSSRASFFGLGNGGNNSRSSFFGFNRSSYYKRSPRGNFMQRSYKQLKRIIRDLVHYAKRHPWKVFFLVLMPLITGGALTALLARFGLRIPASLERMIGMASRAASGDHLGLVNDAVRIAGDLGSGGASSVRVERGRDGGMQWERSSAYAQNDFFGDGMKSVAKFFS